MIGRLCRRKPAYCILVAWVTFFYSPRVVQCQVRGVMCVARWWRSNGLFRSWRLLWFPFPSSSDIGTESEREGGDHGRIVTHSKHAITHSLCRRFHPWRPMKGQRCGKCTVGFISIFFKVLFSLCFWCAMPCVLRLISNCKAHTALPIYSRILHVCLHPPSFSKREVIKKRSHRRSSRS